jgi:RNA recognition motif-containing protein
MAFKLFVGSLAWGTDDDGLQAAFAPYGTVVSASVIKDRESGRSKGFGFVEYETPEEGKAAIDALNNSELDGRTIVVNEARPKEDRPRTGGSNGGSRGGYGGGNGRQSGGGSFRTSSW